jgi:hypothetical protein
MEAYAEKRGWHIQGRQVAWVGGEGGVEEGGVPSLQLANMAITYAKEMEQIV